jgi:alanyl-tRNA synthetase
MEIELLRKVSDLLKQKIKSGVIILGTTLDNQANILVAVTDDLIQKNIKANDIVQKISPLISGSGGGRPQLAQAGGKDVLKLNEAITQAVNLAKEKI